jgi:hypothetical protein
MDQPSLLTVLTHTPRWVFVVFIALLVLGYQQSRDRTVGRGRLLLLPLAMLALSFYGVASSFGLGVLPCLVWVLGVGAVAVLCSKRLKSLARPGPAASFSVQGSWWPLALMMAIFFIKYVTGYALARNLAIVFQPWFIGTVSLSLGLLSGAFLARAGAAWYACSEGRSDA